MDVFSEARDGSISIKTIEMHTSGEPTRIVIDGWGQLEGSTLLEKRTYARNHCDHLRKRLVLEPRGHAEMYGALLVKDTELTKSGAADMGVLFFHNDGYSTMCGHATIALSRLLVDSHDPGFFPRREQLNYNLTTKTTEIRLHAPCGVVRVNVPTTNGKSDGSRPVSFLSVPSFAVSVALKVEIPTGKRWSRLRKYGRSTVEVDIAYGGAFYAMVSVTELGFPRGFAGGHELKEFEEAARMLKDVLSTRKDIYRHPSERDLEYLYGVMITEGEIGLCYFADMQVDRSPTGSCVSAQVALAVEKGQLQIGESRRYESFVSIKKDGIGFRGTAVEKTREGVVVCVEGKAFYTGKSIFYAEDGDNLSDGFVFQLPRSV